MGEDAVPARPLLSTKPIGEGGVLPLPGTTPSSPALPLSFFLIPRKTF